MPDTQALLRRLADPRTPLADKYTIGIEVGLCSHAHRADALDQERFFLDHKDALIREYPGRFVAVVANRPFVGATSSAASGAARRVFPDRIAYIVAIPPVEYLVTLGLGRQ